MSINTLDDYVWRSMPQSGGFETNPNLRKKVDEQGKLLPFGGNTVVFLLDPETCRAISKLQAELYEKAGWMLAEPLTEDTFHMTLHDLENGPPEDTDLPRRMGLAREKAAPMVESFREEAPIRMRATWMFNMVSTSIVLGLRPVDGEGWERLSRMYGELEQVRRLGYALTPHITLAYYRPGTWDASAAEALRSTLRPVELEVTLDPARLVLQKFSDMNHYFEEDPSASAS